MKDIIFKERPPINPIKEHLKIDSTIGMMQKEIWGMRSVDGAIKLLLQKWDRNYILFIAQAIRETFPNVSNEEIGQYL